MKIFLVLLMCACTALFGDYVLPEVCDAGQSKEITCINLETKEREKLSFPKGDYMYEEIGQAGELAFSGKLKKAVITFTKHQKGRISLGLVNLDTGQTKVLAGYLDELKPGFITQVSCYSPCGKYMLLAISD